MKLKFKGGPKDGETHEVPETQDAVEVRNSEGVLLGYYTRKNGMNWTSKWQTFWVEA